MQEPLARTRQQLTVLRPCHVPLLAGEEGGPDYVWGAIRVLGVERVDHGIRSIEDPELVAYMADNRLPITLCPLSNLHLQVGTPAATGLCHSMPFVYAI